MMDQASSPCLVLHAETRAVIEDIRAATNAAAAIAAVVSTSDNDTVIVAPVEIILNKAHMYIGRSSMKLPVDILLIARKGERDVISRRHAEITIHEKIVIANDDDDEINDKVIHQYILHDLKSINGVFVNEIKIDSVVLSDGDIIQFGGVSNMDYGSKLKSCDTCIKYVFKHNSIMNMTSQQQQQQQQKQQQQKQKSSVVIEGQNEVDGNKNTNIKWCSKTSVDDILEINGVTLKDDRVNKQQDGIKHDIACRINPPISSSSPSSSRTNIKGHDNTTTTTPNILKRNEMKEVNNIVYDNSRPTNDGVVLKSMDARNSSDSTSKLKRKHNQMINDDNDAISRIDDYDNNVHVDNNMKSKNKHSNSVVSDNVTNKREDNKCIDVIRDDGIKTNYNHNNNNPHHPLKTNRLLPSETKDNKQNKQNNNKRTQLPSDNSDSSITSSKVMTEQVYTENLRDLQNHHTLVLCNLIKSHHSNEKLNKEQMDTVLKEHQVEKTELLRLISQQQQQQQHDQQQQQQQHASILHDETDKCNIIEEFKMKIKSFELMINKLNKAKELSDEQWQAKYDNDMESLRLTLSDRFEKEKIDLLTTWQVNCNELEQKLKDTNSSQININEAATATNFSASLQKDHPTKTSIADYNNRDIENSMLNTITTIEASLICFLCSELLLDAVVLSCSHGFCRACIESHWNKIDIDYDSKKNKTVSLCCFCPKCNINVSIRTTTSTTSSNSKNRSNGNINKSYNGQEGRMIYNYFRSDHLDNLVGIIVDTFPDSLKTVSSTFMK